MMGFRFTLPLLDSKGTGFTEEEEEVWPSGPVSAEDARPSGPKVVEESGQPAQTVSGPPGPVVDKQSGPLGPVEIQDEPVKVEEPVAEAVPPEPPSFLLQTPAPPSPPSSTTAPPAPATFKQPLPKNISSPTPFPTQSSSSPASSTFIPPPPSEAPPASSSSAGASSSGPSSAGPSIPFLLLLLSHLHLPLILSFILLLLPLLLQSSLRVSNLKFGQFRQAISALGSDDAHTTSIQVMGRISVQKGGSLSFHRFVFREYHQGHIKFDVLSPLLSEWLTRALFFPHSLLSTSPTFTLELLHEFRWLAGARGKAVVRVVAADQAGNVELERGVRGAFLGFRRDSRFFGSSITFLSVVVRRLFRNASLVGYLRFFVSQERVFVVLGVCPGTVWYRRVGPFVRDCKAERLFLCCVVWVGYWLDQPIVCSRVVASFFLTRALPLAVVREFVTRGRVRPSGVETGLVATEVPVATVIPIATAFGVAFFLRLTDLSGCCGTQGGHVLVTVWAAVAIRGEVSLSSSSGGGAWWSGRRLVRSGSGTMGARRRCVWGTSGCSILEVGLPTDVATAERVATSEEASPQLDATLSRHNWPLR
ncbi:hypothetical protein Taro_032781 [Colocasia esculenta]|uniref:Uncharacterized protein n=1 Tax=Colocasia esculenta TaxID=4460 RepID=A0A843VS70_COLES|nr:hypothetical protein [Colocasia esculenta]